MRGLLLVLAVVQLGAAPQHRRFKQKNLPAGSCVPATGAPIVDVDWADFGNTTAVTRTVGYAAAVDPGCARGYERLQIPATTAAQFTSINNPNGTLCPSGVSPLSMGCWVRGTSGSGATDFCTEKSGYICHDLPFTTTPTFYKLENVALVGGGAGVIIGNLSAVTGNARGAADLLVWGCRCVSGATISP